VNFQAKQLVCYHFGYNFLSKEFKHETAGLVEENCHADTAAEIFRSFSDEPYLDNKPSKKLSLEMFSCFAHILRPTAVVPCIETIYVGFHIQDM
jgi:hypothetical protein